MRCLGEVSSPQVPPRVPRLGWKLWGLAQLGLDQQVWWLPEGIQVPPRGVTPSGWGSWGSGALQALQGGAGPEMSLGMCQRLLVLG